LPAQPGSILAARHGLADANFSIAKSWP